VTARPAVLVLEDGSSFEGSAFGAPGEAFGEAVFNTGMAGYQEILTDPSYRGQIVTMTAPQQGNYGVNGTDPESDRIQVSGFAVREAARRASSWRAEGRLADALSEAGVVGIEEIDTRRLTLRIRERGAMRAAVSTVDLDPVSLLARVRGSDGMEGRELASVVTTGAPYGSADLVGKASAAHGRVLRVAAIDYGIKRNILRNLAAQGIEATVFPAGTAASSLLEGGFDGVFLSNGPGDPAATGYAVSAVSELLGKTPIFGICLGHQLLGLAAGGRTVKMKFGHRGVNHPVADLRSGRVQITSHNHGFAVDPDGWSQGRPLARPTTATAIPPVVATEAGSIELTHWNLNDGTLEGMRCLDVPAFSVQYHPEAAPGPHDANPLFAEFRRLMEDA
jgi:carbamoyl-phosphate synthase small subunit